MYSIPTGVHLSKMSDVTLNSCSMLTTSSTPLLFILLLDFTIYLAGARFHSSPDVAFILVSNVSLILNYFFELCLLTASGYFDSVFSLAASSQ